MDLEIITLSEVSQRKMNIISLVEYVIDTLLLLLSRFSRVQLCATS